MRPVLHLLLGVVLITGACLAAPAGAASDLHQLWDETCASCHGHAGAFARERLRLDNGVLEGSHPGRDLKAFLARHTRLSAEDIAAIYTMLSQQVARPDLFRQRCSICHGSAAELARGLVVRDDRLYGRSSGRAIEEFLLTHGRLAAADVPQFLAVLRRVEGEVHRGGP